jgi:diguanylate cyclase (GGDEF)-like protein/PAS domain S-box-containing protein
MNQREYIMNLSTFILDNIELILLEWELFASTIFPSKQKEDTPKLRDHAKKMLVVIAKDLDQSQSKKEQIAKSKGQQLSNSKSDTPAEKHGYDRMEEGLSMQEMASEYRALRASVTKLFRDVTNGKLQANDINDLIRFNEAIDQALTESIASYSDAAEQQSRLLDTLLSSSPDLNYILDLEGKFLYVNSAMRDLYQKDVLELLGTALYNGAMPPANQVLTHIKDIIKTRQQCRGEIKVPSSQDDPRYFEYIYAPVFNKKGEIEAIACASRDISDQKNAEALIWQTANYDPLTGLVNRRLFHEKLDQTVKHGKRSDEGFALLFIDLDKFKEVNDTLGHNIGDLLLKQTAHRIKKCLRDADTIARIGGDEFTVILENAPNVEQIKSVTEKILTVVHTPFSIKKHKINISASIGITVSHLDGSEPDTLIKHADSAMYLAKKEGGNRLKIYKNMY